MIPISPAGICGIVVAVIILIGALTSLLLYYKRHQTLINEDETQSLCESVHSQQSAINKTSLLQNISEFILKKSIRNSSEGTINAEWKPVSRTSDLNNKAVSIVQSKVDNGNSKIDKKFLKNPPPQPVFQSSEIASADVANSSNDNFFDSFLKMTGLELGDKREKIDSASYGKGRLCFGVTYIHTLNKFFVHLKRLQLSKETLNFISLHNSIKNKSDPTNLQFQVSLRSSEETCTPTTEEVSNGGEEHTNRFGGPKLTSVYSCDLTFSKRLDDSFEFSLPVSADGNLAELQIALLLPEVFSNNKKKNSNLDNRFSYGRLLGYVCFTLDGSSLINDPHSLSEIWRDLIVVRSVDDSRRADFLEKFEDLLLKPVNLTRYSPISTIGKLLLQIKTNQESLTVTILLHSVKNLFTYSNNKNLFQFRVTFFCGGKLIATRFSSGINLSPTNLTNSPIKGEQQTNRSHDLLNMLEDNTGFERKFESPLKFSYKINSTDFVKNSKILGVIVSLCSNQGHLIGHVSIGSRYFTDEPTASLWESAMREPFQSNLEWISMK